jgi:predicted nucleic-acid-binding protein
MEGSLVVIVDANIIIRFFMNDNIEQANKAEKILKECTVFIPREVLAEIVYVLIGVYGIPRKDVVDSLLLLINSSEVVVAEKEKILEALKIFRDSNLDFVDSLLCSYSGTNTIATFDKKLKSCIRNKRGNLLDP